jgi:hypothetical protein
MTPDDEALPEGPPSMDPMLISAGGWCTPSDQIFELCRDWTIEDYRKAWQEERAKRKAWKRRAKIAEAKLLLGRK